MLNTDRHKEGLDQMLNTDRREAAGIEVVFGDGTDGDTFYTVFQGLPLGYIVALNGVDYVVDNIDSEGIHGFLYLGSSGIGSTVDHDLVTIPWAEIYQLWIY